MKRSEIKFSICIRSTDSNGEAYMIDLGLLNIHKLHEHLTCSGNEVPWTTPYAWSAPKTLVFGADQRQEKKLIADFERKTGIRLGEFCHNVSIVVKRV